MSGENGQEGLKPSIRAGWLGFVPPPRITGHATQYRTAAVDRRRRADDGRDRYHGGPGAVHRRTGRGDPARARTSPVRCGSARPRKPRRVHHRTDAGVSDELHGADELHRALAADRRTPVVERRRLRVTPSRGDGVRSDRACGRERRASRSPRARRRRRVRSRTGPRGSDRLGDD